MEKKHEAKIYNFEKFKKFEILNSDVKLLRFNYFNDNKFNLPFYKTI